MKTNEKTQLMGKNIILIPYEAKHVKKYHEWMKNPELQKLTASEPLSLEDEYKMQKSWRNDEDKCTFLIISKSCYDKTKDEIAALIGDTNLFINFCDNLKIGEAEIMIADELYRGIGLGWEAMLLMLKYGQEILGIQKFIAKISEDNVKSINMFIKMNFTESSRSEVFKEITLEKLVDDNFIIWLNDQVDLVIENYDL